jgi:tight adherence protein B
MRSPLWLPVGVLVPLVAWRVVRFRARRRMRGFEDQLPDNLAVLSQSLRAGFSLLQALDSVADNAHEPSRSEFRRVLTQTRLGANVEAAMDELGVRMESRDFGWVIAVVSIQSRVGGNMAEILDSVGATILERQRLRRHVKALTAQGRMTQLILTCLPPGIGIIIYLLDPELMNSMLKHSLGWVLLGVAAASTLVGTYLMGKVVKVEL